MTKEESPIIEFEKDASAPIIRYDLPSPSSYEGKVYIEISNDAEITEGKNISTYFDPKTTGKPPKYKEILEKYRNEIQEYLYNSRKQDLERDLYTIFEIDEVEREVMENRYSGTYSFDEDELGTFPKDWENLSYQGCKVHVIHEFNEHRKVLYMDNGDTGENFRIKNVFTQEQANGTVELWASVDDFSENRGIRIELFSGVSEALKERLFAIQLGEYFYYKVDRWIRLSPTIPPCNTNQWYHIRIDFEQSDQKYMDLGPKQFQVFINGDKFGPFTTKLTGNATLLSINSMNRRNVVAHIDAIGYSWDPDYTIGDNFQKEMIPMNILAKIILMKRRYLTFINNIEEKFDDKGNVIDHAIKAKNELFNYYVKINIGKKIPVFYRSMGGKLKIKFVPIPPIPEPRFMFVESHKLTNFPGDYGAGTVIKTFSLLPREVTEISIKTWKKTEETTQKASSILDSYTTEKADEFERNIQAESARTSKIDTSFSYNVNASASASWGWGRARVSAGASSSTNSSREESAKNVMNATAKHAQTASAQREVNVDTSYERSVEEGIETATMRTIRNLNVTRTLNFTFRQMNQEFHSILHLTDLRLAFYNGYPGSYREYALSDLGYMINKYMTDYETCYNFFYNMIFEEYGSSTDDQGNLIGNMIDYQGNLQALIEEATDNAGNYLRVKPPNDKEGNPYGKQAYEMRPQKENQDADIRYVEGVILGNKKLTMKTEGVIVEALMGKVNALDDYAYEYRIEKIRKKRNENMRIEAGINLVNELIKAQKFDQAVIAYKETFGVEAGIEVLKNLFSIKFEASKET